MNASKLILHLKETNSWDFNLKISKEILDDFVKIIQKGVWKNTKVEVQIEMK